MQVYQKSTKPPEYMRKSTSNSTSTVPPKALIKAQNVWNKVQWKLKKDKPNYFDGVRIPQEILQRFFEWSDLSKVKTYRLLCRCINQAVMDPHFARINVLNVVPVDYNPNRPLPTTPHANSNSIFGGSKRQAQIDWIGEGWIRWSAAHRKVFVTDFLTPQVTVIDLKMKATVVCYQHPKSPCIPPVIGHLTNLTKLVLTEVIGISRRYTGSIPFQIGNLVNLVELDLRRNHLTGPIPAELGQLKSLRYLNFHGNVLTGSIPPELGSLCSLQYLILSSNKLTGPIPSEIGNLQALKTLELWENSLTGMIPPEIGELGNLEDLNLYSNSLSGDIPVELHKLEALKKMNLDRNYKLTGELERRRFVDEHLFKLPEKNEVLKIRQARSAARLARYKVSSSEPSHIPAFSGADWY
ncbi:hypothetical protein BDR26DRAFT_915408 [Obelidium mucronatum]|nr:hypothetical protein BDR26DRAFT_915408 [Obelidium mucronatum]